MQSLLPLGLPFYSPKAPRNEECSNLPKDRRLRSFQLGSAQSEEGKEGMNRVGSGSGKRH